MIVGFWIFLILLCGGIAHSKGRSVFGFGLLAALISIFALPFVIGARRAEPNPEQQDFIAGTPIIPLIVLGIIVVMWISYRP